MPINVIAELGLSIPVGAAPMAGGPTTPELVIAAAGAGGMGFLAGGYKSAASLGEQIVAVRDRTAMFGVNLFAPNPIPVSRAGYDRYRALLKDAADAFAVTLPDTPIEDDDQWRDKIDVLLDRPVPLVSFTFGLPDPAALTALRKAGTILVQTVTSTEEAILAEDAGMDALVVQTQAAGGHSGTFTPERMPPRRTLPALLAEIGDAVRLPAIAAGGLADPGSVASAIHCGATAVMVGTALLLAPECGTSIAHRRALTDPAGGDTVITRAFTGRPARALRNRFIDTYDRAAPAGYPAVHHLTSPLRRAAATAQNSAYLNLWAGEGYRAAGERAAAQTLLALAASL